MSDAANTQQATPTLETQAEVPKTSTTESSEPIQSEPNEMTQSTSELFSIALSAQQKNNLDDALNAYSLILSSADLTKDQLSVAHHNLSIIYLSKGDFAKAQIENYLALALNPGNNAAKTLNKSNEHFKSSIIQMDRSWSTTASLKFIPLEVFFIALLGCLILIGKSLVDYFRSRALALQDNLEIPNFPMMFKILIGPFFIIVCFLGIRIYDENTVKAIIVKENTEVASSSGSNQALITTVNPGLEVIVLRQQTTDNVQYAQIRSTGQFSGWVKLENLALINLNKHF